MLFFFFSPIVDSLSPRGGSFNEVIEDAMRAEDLRSALDIMASSSRNPTKRSSGWTSSEDEADPMEQDEEGPSLHLCS
jgi:protein phosphatase inhibitor 2